MNFLELALDLAVDVLLWRDAKRGWIGWTVLVVAVVVLVLAW